MIYIIQNVNNTITTDSWIEYIPESITVYLDDKLVGSYLNESTKNEYIVLSIPKEDITNFQNKEYKLKLVNNNNYTLIKIELVSVKTNIIDNSNTVINNKQEVFYE